MVRRVEIMQKKEKNGTNRGEMEDGLTGKRIII